MGARIKRMFIAFLISSFMAPVGIWLGIEYIKMSGLLEKAGQEKQNLPLSRAARFFKFMAIFCFISAGMYVINMAVVYPLLYGPLMNLVDHPSDPSLLVEVATALGVVFTLAIVSMAITLVSSRLTRLAWENVFENLEGEPSSTERMSGSFQIARVIKGAAQSFQASIMLIIVMTLLGTMFWYAIGLLSGPIITPSLAIAPVTLIFMIPAAILAIIGGISSLAGMVNQAVGLFDLGRNMGLDATIERRILIVGAGERVASSAASGRNICPRCKEPRPDDHGVRYCPSCGNPF